MLVVLTIASPAGGQTGGDDGPAGDLRFPDGEWVGRLQSLNTTPTGMALTVIDFTLVTEDGAGTDGEITRYVARTENREVDASGSASAQMNVGAHDVDLKEGELPPTFAGDVSWRGRVVSDSALGKSEIELPEEVLPVTWVLTPRAVSCVSVSARSGGTEGDRRFRTEMVAFRTGESDTSVALIATITAIEEGLQTGTIDPPEAAQLLLTAVALLREHNEELSALEACALEIPGLGELDPLKVLLEPLLQQLLGLIKDVPEIFPPHQLMEILMAAYEAGALGPHAINDDVAEQLEAIYSATVLIIAVAAAEANEDVAGLQDLMLTGALFGWSNVVSAADAALKDILSAPISIP